MAEEIYKGGLLIVLIHLFCIGPFPDDAAIQAWFVYSISLSDGSLSVDSEIEAYVLNDMSRCYKLLQSNK